MRHVIELCAEGLYRPDIATLDCGTLNFGDGNRAYISTPDYCREGAGILRELGVKVELEVFDTGNLWFVKQMIKEGLVPAPGHDPAVHRHPLRRAGGHRAPARHGELPAGGLRVDFLRRQPHADAVGRAVDTARRQRARRARGQPVPERGVYASNAQLVEKARTIIEAMGARIVAPAQARERLQLH